MLQKSKRLLTEEVKNVVEKGRPIHSMFLIIRLISGLKSSKFSVSVPKKVLKTAVSRNAIRRRIYTIVRKLEVGISSGVHVVIILKNGSEKLTHGELLEEIKKAFVKSGILK